MKAAKKKSTRKKGAAKSSARMPAPRARSDFGDLLTSGGVRLVDLTQTLSPNFPTMVLPPEFGQCRPFRMEEVSRYDERGPGWYWNNVSFGEHSGTHFDAPISGFLDAICRTMQSIRFPPRISSRRPASSIAAPRPKSTPIFS